MAGAFLEALLAARMENPAAMELRIVKCEERNSRILETAVYPPAPKEELKYLGINFISNDQISGKNTETCVYFLPLDDIEQIAYYL